MATSKTFFGLRRGSTKSMTFQVLNGQQITKDRVYGGRNPRSDAQMTQRSQFLSAVRFYERSLRRFFKFAFESKKQTESEYNAFMRLNAKIGPYITKAQGDAVGFPMVAPWMISQGSLQTLPQAIIQDPDLGDEISLLIAKNWDGDGPYTIAQLSQLIRAAHPSVLEGDIITIVVIRGTEDGTAFVTDYDATNITNQNEWIVEQFIINSSDEREIGEVLAQANVSVVDGNLYLVGMVGDTTKVYAGAIVVSRNTAGGLVVSTNTLKLNALATTAYETMRDNAHREQVLAWWGAQQQAILQGSLATPGEQPTPAPGIVVGANPLTFRDESGETYADTNFTLPEGVSLADMNNGYLAIKGMSAMQLHWDGSTLDGSSADETLFVHFDGDGWITMESTTASIGDQVELVAITYAGETLRFVVQ